jgi:hypothetical protein
MKYCLLAILILSGCTVVQTPIQNKVISFDGNNQNAGIICKNYDGFIVTANFKDRYNALIAIYGDATLADGSPIFTPALIKNTGITDNKDGTYTINKEGMANMVLLSKLKRQGFKP